MVTAWEGPPWEPRAWQAEALPLILDSARARKRPLVSAVMGSGKSVLQAEVAMAALGGARGRAVVLSAPKKDLVNQLAETMRERVGDRYSVGRWFTDAKEPDADVVICCNASLPTLAVEVAERGTALLLLDEAHRSEAEGAKGAVEVMRPVVLVGFTATPFRSVPRESLSLYDDVAYRYTMADALRDEVLVPPRIVRWDGGLGVGVDRACLEMIRAHGHGPGVVSAATKQDACDHAEWLTSMGVPALPIHSDYSMEDRARRLEALRRGDVRCLVHVSLLAEGVDLPWLRWICLRRHVGASVRFLQELGRPCRTLDPDKYPEDVERFGAKVDAAILDPHLLLGRFGLDGGEAIGAAMQAAADAEARDPAVVARELAEQEAMALDVLTAYLGELRDAMEDAGGLDARWTDGEGDGWRLADVSAKQVQRLKTCRKLTRYMQKDYREPVKALLNVPWALTRGQASDLIDVCFGGRDWAQEFRKPWQQEYQAQWRAEFGIEVPEMGLCKVVTRMKA